MARRDRPAVYDPRRIGGAEGQGLTVPKDLPAYSDFALRHLRCICRVRARRVFPILERAGHPQAGAFFFLRIVAFESCGPATEKNQACHAGTNRQQPCWNRQWCDSSLNRQPFRRRAPPRDHADGRRRRIFIWMDNGHVTAFISSIGDVHNPTLATRLIQR